MPVCLAQQATYERCIKQPIEIEQQLETLVQLKTHLDVAVVRVSRLHRRLANDFYISLSVHLRHNFKFVNFGKRLCR